MDWAHAVATRKSKRSLPDVPEGPVAVALLTDVAFQPSVGKGRNAAAPLYCRGRPLLGLNVADDARIEVDLLKPIGIKPR